MNLEAYQRILDDLKLDTDKKYLSLQMPIDGFDLNERKIFSHFHDAQGSRYWFRSKDGRYDSIGIEFQESIKRDKYSAEVLEEQKTSLFAKIQQVAVKDGMASSLGLFGGTRFDDKDTTDEWNDFGMVEFHLPKWQFDLANSELFYTVRTDEADLDEILIDISDKLKEIGAITPEPAQAPEVHMMKDIFPEEWKTLVDEALGVLDDTDFRKIVLARQRLLTFKAQADPLYLLDRLNDESGTYTIYYEKGQSIFISKSPEKLFDIKDGVLRTNAIAGSAERTGVEATDEQQKAFLLNDEKNRYEHELVRESIVQSLQPYTEDIEFAEGPDILSNRYIYHLHTPISAKLAEGASLFALLDAIHPTPAVGGMPKDKARDYIMENEYGTRGLYAAPLGMIHENDDSEFVVSIRSMLLNSKSATLFAGCGIVRGSSSEKEHEETRVKFTPMLNVLGVEPE
ncbi:isochorismate synthase MenF [Salinicoccus siamensis]|uniref:isochorismate synthase n=1 Tax=Salinicoccus siamensis TaxID=381830 RepID=A0ABV5Z0L2_9STAP